MAHVIDDSCVSCGSCSSTCPVGAIAEGDGKYVVDASACIDCGACEGACPTGAIHAINFPPRKPKVEEPQPEPKKEEAAV